MWTSSSAPLGSGHPVCRHGVPAAAHHSRHDRQDVETGSCWDNACMESFLGTLEHHLIYRCQYCMREDEKQDIFECFEGFYSRLCRLPTWLLSPQPSSRRGQLLFRLLQDGHGLGLLRGGQKSPNGKPGGVHRIAVRINTLDPYRQSA
jgi:hypothetical protein